MENKLEIGGTTIIGIENGSNTNGSYTKFSDGTMIQYGRVNLGACSAGARITGVYDLPVAFKDDSYGLSVTLDNGTAFGAGQYIAISTYRTASAFDIIFTSAGAQTNAYMSWIAIGRWK